MKNKIGWCNLTFNPVWGCRNICPYCYARAIAKRFWKKRYMEEIDYQFKLHPDWAWTGDHLLGLQSFKPTWLESKFNKKLPVKPQRIFVGSMSEIYYWEQEWIERVIEKVKQYPKHTFIFLTKHPGVYAPWVWPKNCWLGITVTSTKNYNFYDSGCDDSSIHLAYQKFKSSNTNNLKFICFEPLLESRYTISIDLEGIDWVILGAESGNRRGKVLPGLDPVLKIFRYCQKNKIPIYVKDNLGRPDVPFDFCRGYKQFPNYKQTINEL